ncbi:hypothetical protein [Hanstruepera ponticola]|uniref:hypothetical protein n=1 Tax=Hanstruepera ponticola TaxID=2042995 RepID=UPI00178123EB|nr:hypothetical protein [Hanstruepera ponticola]
MNSGSNFYDKPNKLIIWGIVFIILGFVLCFITDYGVPCGIAIGLGGAYFSMGLHKKYIK